MTVGEIIGVVLAAMAVTGCIEMLLTPIEWYVIRKIKY